LDSRSGSCAVPIPPNSSPTLVRDLLAVEAELVTPVLSVEGPELMLLVDLDVTATCALRGGHLLLRLLVDVATGEGGDLELEGVDLVREILALG